jgi:hypothetical protein
MVGEADLVKLRLLPGAVAAGNEAARPKRKHAAKIRRLRKGLIIAESIYLNYTCKGVSQKDVRN